MDTAGLLKDLFCTGFLPEPERHTEVSQATSSLLTSILPLSDPTNASLTLKNKSKWLKLIYDLVPFLPRVAHSMLITPFISITPFLSNDSACLCHSTFTFWNSRTLSLSSLWSLFHQSLSTSWEDPSIQSLPPGSLARQCKVHMPCDAVQDSLPPKSQCIRRVMPKVSSQKWVAWWSTVLPSPKRLDDYYRKGLTVERAKLKHVVSWW